jgi:hypothetical protein
VGIKGLEIRLALRQQRSDVRIARVLSAHSQHAFHGILLAPTGSELRCNGCHCGGAVV